MKTAISRAHLPAALWGGACIALALVIGGLELNWGSGFTLLCLPCANLLPSRRKHRYCQNSPCRRWSRAILKR